jgi:outer membrane murein-binding lipoprotein Lpp
MTVMIPGQTSTDQRVDALAGQVHALDKKVDALDGRVGVLEKKVDEGFAGIDKRLDKLTDSLDAYNRTLIAGLFVTVAALIGTSAF